MDESLRAAIQQFNDGRFSEFQDAMEAAAGRTRAASERQFYFLMGKLAEALLQFSDGDLADAVDLITVSLRKLDEFMPRFRGINVEALRDDFRQVLVELRDVREGKKEEPAPTRMPRLRILPQ
jgi:hypothetical protein